MKKKYKYDILVISSVLTFLIINTSRKILLNTVLSKKFYDLIFNITSETGNIIKPFILSILPVFILFLFFYLLIVYILKKYDLSYQIKIKDRKLNILFNKIENKIKLYFSIIIISCIIVTLFTSTTLLKSINSNKEDFIIKNYYKLVKKTNLIKENTIKNHLIEQGVYVFPEPKELIKIDIDTMGQELPSLKNDGSLKTIISIIVDGISLKTFGEIQVQGSSTQGWPKKNWDIKLFKDENREEEIKIKIGESIASDKWIAKADWNDPSLLRNYLSYNLWGDIIESRKLPIKYEVDNAFLKNNIKENKYTKAQGYPSTHPVEIKINNEHYGLSMLTLGHDPDNFNIDKNNPKHLYFDFDARGGADITKTWTKFNSEGIGKWIDGYYPKNQDFTNEHRASIDELGLLINGSLTNFKINAHKTFDKNNMIDMLLFYEVVNDWDAVSQDIEVVTYDLKKWYFLPWDKDTTFGMFWDSTGIIENSEHKLLIDYINEDPSQKPWYKTYKTYKKDIELRYAELRDIGVFTVDNINELSMEVHDKISPNLWTKELKKWEQLGRLPLEENNKDQILKWFEKRLVLLDKHFKYNKS